MTAKVFKRDYYVFHPKLYRIALRMLGNEEDAADMVQETYCSLWDKRHTLTHVKTPEAYAVETLRNRCLNKLRQKDKEPVNVIFPELIGNSIEQQLYDKDEINLIEKLIAGLPERQRMVFQLRHYDDCAYEEIGLIMDLSVENVRMILSRTRKSLREQFNKISMR
jgi:RNA polymerase sigma factor, sigma-70 family